MSQRMFNAKFITLVLEKKLTMFTRKKERKKERKKDR